MRKIDSLSITDDQQVKRTISFWHGNPADLSADDPVDLIIVSRTMLERRNASP